MRDRKEEKDRQRDRDIKRVKERGGGVKGAIEKERETIIGNTLRLTY